MKVAVVATSHTSGGAEEYLYRLYSRLASTYSVDATLFGHLPQWNSTIGNVVDVRAAEKFTRRRPLAVQARESIKYVPTVVNAVREFDPDVVHIQYFREKLLLPKFITSRYPILWTEHAPLPANFPIGAVALLRKQSRPCSIISIGSGVERSLVENGFDCETVINPIPDSFVTRSQAKDLASDGSREDYVLYSGRLHEYKRVSMLIDAAKRLPDTRFVIAGDGPAGDQLRSDAPSNVEFLGHLDGINPSLYKQARVLVIPSGQLAREGMPMTLLEARACDCPVIMAADCHATGDALRLGAELFEPNVEALVAKLTDTEFTPTAVPATTMDELSEATWAQRHYGILERLAGRQTYA
ncbi:MAG: glycosyltransferase [Gordonia sp. (in: high G+C Gram-positive bacteria)]